MRPSRNSAMMTTDGKPATSVIDFWGMAVPRLSDSAISDSASSCSCVGIAISAGPVSPAAAGREIATIATSARPLRMMLAPVRPYVRADRAAAGAHEAPSKVRHRHSVRVAVDVDDGLVVAVEARHRERAHAVGAHVGEVHRLAG